MGTENTTNNTNKSNGEEKMISVITGSGEKQIPESSILDFEPVTFEAFGKTTRVNSYELARMIREMFQKKFHDVIGANITWDGRNFNTTLFFQNNTEPIPDGKIKNLINLQSAEGINSRSLWERNQLVQNKKSGETFALNDATKILLSDFMYGGRQANKPNNKQRWAQNTFERRVPAPTALYQYGAENIIIGVTGLDIKVICHKLYGNKIVTSTEYDENGTAYNNQSKGAYYELRFGKMMQDGSVMINIEQFDRQKVEELVKKENPQIAMYSGVQMF